MKAVLCVAFVVVLALVIGVGSFVPTRTVAALDPTQTAIAATISWLNVTQTAIISQTLYPSPPSIEPQAAPILRVFVRGADNLLYQKLYVNGQWSDWHWLAVPAVGITTDSPSAVTSPDGRVDLFVRGKDNALWHTIFYANGSQTAWESLGGELTSGPAAAGAVSEQQLNQ